MAKRSSTRAENSQLKIASLIPDLLSYSGYFWWRSSLRWNLSSVKNLSKLNQWLLRYAREQADRPTNKQTDRQSNWPNFDTFSQHYVSEGKYQLTLQPMVSDDTLVTRARSCRPTRFLIIFCKRFSRSIVDSQREAVIAAMIVDSIYIADIRREHLMTYVVLNKWMQFS